MNQEYHVKLDAFEGPLDLLLHLIRKYEIDIYDIPVADITEQYTQYIKTMQQLELNIASEYLVMAATLLALKSQMLLPKQTIDEPEENLEDPREELTQRLLEYSKYKEAARTLQEIETNENQLFTRGPLNMDYLKAEPTTMQGDLSIYDMIDALHKMFERKKWREPLETKITKIDIPLEERMEQIVDKVKHQKQGVLFDQLFVYETRGHIVITFLALLELIKNNRVYCKQERHLDALYIYDASS